jgi:hypothetical protein
MTDVTMLLTSGDAADDPARAAGAFNTMGMVLRTVTDYDINHTHYCQSSR